MGTGRSSLLRKIGRGVKLITCLHLVLKLILIGAVLPLIHASYEPDAYLSINETVTLSSIEGSKAEGVSKLTSSI
jgi:hypothetical protein